eukprot:ANDGO_07621.mRNA.1 UDP-glucose 6-dehydrogenase
MGLPNKITVIGIGRLGLCFALCLENVGFDVVGVDVRADYCDSLNRKTFRSDEPGVNDLLAGCKRFAATTDLQAGLAHGDVVYILTETPLSGSDDFYDHSRLSSVLQSIESSNVSNKHLVISCTVMPGFVRNIGRFLVSKSLARNCTLSYNPAFVAQGSVVEGYQNGGYFGIVLAGIDDPAVEPVMRHIYGTLSQSSPHPPKVCIMSSASAEIAKLSSNCFRTMKIAFANMIGDIADATPGADKYAICEALGADDSIGNKCMRPGYGYGGPCYPRDNKALSHYSSSVGVMAHLSAASDASNEWHSKKMAADLILQNKEEYVFSGVAYKPMCPVPMIDNSQKLVVASIVAKAGKRVVIKDQPAIIKEVQKKFGSLFSYEVL